jgi:hypothetical protein
VNKTSRKFDLSFSLKAKGWLRWFKTTLTVINGFFSVRRGQKRENPQLHDISRGHEEKNALHIAAPYLAFQNGFGCMHAPHRHAHM